MGSGEHDLPSPRGERAVISPLIGGAFTSALLDHQHACWPVPLPRRSSRSASQRSRARLPDEPSAVAIAINQPLRSASRHAHSLLGRGI